MAIGGGLGVGGCATRLPAEAPSLPATVSGERRQTDARAGPLSYYVAGDGPPLLLIHSINAAASAYEVRPIFEDLRQDHRVFAPELPGFGFSDRSDRRYDPALYTAAVFDMLDVIAEDQGQAAPLDALAISLSSEFLARAASQEPAAFRRLVLVTPTGFDAGHRGCAGRRARRASSPGYTVCSRGRHGGRACSICSSAGAASATSSGAPSAATPCPMNSSSIPGDRRISRGPGTHHTPSSRRRCSAPTFATSTRSSPCRSGCRTARAAISGIFSGKEWTQERPNWRFEAFPTGALPHFEVPDTFNAALKGFLSG